MKRAALFGLIVAATTLGGLVGCDPGAQTPLPDPEKDGVSGRKPRAVDLSIMEDQKKIYDDRKAEMERSFAVAPPTSAPATTDPSSDPAATMTAPSDTAPPTPDATQPTPPPN